MTTPRASLMFSPAELRQVWPEWDEAEEKALLGVLSSRRWSRVLDPKPGESEAGQAEDELARYLSVPYFLTVTSGTVALELALLAAEVRARI